MKLAEALTLRTDCQKKISQMRQRLMRSAKVQEGEQPPEDPQVLLGELDGALAEPLRRRIAELTRLIQRINKTNASTNIDSATLSDALARRDTLGTKRGVLDGLIQEASMTHNRYSRSEVRFTSTVDIAALQRQIDSLSQEHRLLGSQIQSLNWQVELMDA